MPEKIHGIEKGVEFLLKNVRFVGSQAARWAELLIEQRGVQASRSLLGLLRLSKKYCSDELNRACDVAWRAKATYYRAIKRLLENSQAAAHGQELFEDLPDAVALVGRFANDSVDRFGRHLELENLQVLKDLVPLAGREGLLRRAGRNCLGLCGTGVHRFVR